jgi:hypothetical protein
LKENSNIPKYAIFEVRVQNFEGLTILLKDDPKPSWGA